jgi:hypothetical protein
MQEPCFERLRIDIEKGEKGSASYTTGVHPNPY